MRDNKFKNENLNKSIKLNNLSYDASAFLEAAIAPAATLLAVGSQLIDLSAVYPWLLSGVGAVGIGTAAVKYNDAVETFKNKRFSAGDGIDSDLKKFFNSITVAMSSGALAAGSKIMDISDLVAFIAAGIAVVSIGATIQKKERKK